jgi:HNH endonuclease
MTPFIYPSQPHIRRHGPRGYRDRESYRPWLRDEFAFRCVYCLRREQWDRATSLHIEHFLPTSQFPAQELIFDNLLYACTRCNAAKSDQATANPCRFLLASAVTAETDGRLSATEPRSKQLIAQLRLNCQEMVHFRRLWLEIIAMAKRANPELYRQLLGFPDNLPNLRVLRPPGGNDRPDGIAQSHLEKRERGTLAETY